MHMADALVSPAVGGTLWAAAAGVTAYCSKRLAESPDDRKVPLMGVVGAFIFAAQMINFTIPGTGSSGHLGGGAMLAILLGPHAAFLVMASVLTVQALFFADGGFLALGCNIMNLGFFPVFIAYPLLYSSIAGANPSQGRILWGALAASVFGLQLGALGVVTETVLSGMSELEFNTFILLMLPLHLVIGIVEGLVTATVVGFIFKNRPDVLEECPASSASKISRRGVIAAFLALAIFSSAILSLYSSDKPDGLEWAIQRITGADEPEKPDEGLYKSIDEIQGKTALFPDYGFRDGAGAGDNRLRFGDGKSMAGLIGSALTLFILVAVGFAIRRRRKK